MRLILALFISLTIALAGSDRLADRGLGLTRVKLQHVEDNAAQSHPDSTPTRFSEQEINQYISSGNVKLPEGVRTVKFQGQPGLVTAACDVDFDQIEAGRNSANPMLSLFSGVHDIIVIAHAKGIGGEGIVEVQSVSLDGVEIPRFLLQLFVQKYLQPKYPKVGLQSRFALPDRIDSAIVGNHDLVVTQK